MGPSPSIGGISSMGPCFGTWYIIGIQGFQIRGQYSGPIVWIVGSTGGILTVQQLGSPIFPHSLMNQRSVSQVSWSGLRHWVEGPYFWTFHLPELGVDVMRELQ